jgi:hypothetical protein
MVYVIDLWMLSIYADTKWHIEMLCGNTVKIITPDGDATIVILTKVEVVLSVFWTGNLLRGVPEVDECDSPRSVTRMKRHVAHNLDRFGPRGA